MDLSTYYHFRSGPRVKTVVQSLSTGLPYYSIFDCVQVCMSAVGQCLLKHLCTTTTYQSIFVKIITQLLKSNEVREFVQFSLYCLPYHYMYVFAYKPEFPLTFYVTIGLYV
jgi:hypothetical protein